MTATPTEFYETHAQDFSKSRFRIWPDVKELLDSLPPYSTVLDIGCGNGKNMLYRKDLNMTGLEYSEALCEICINRGLNVVQGSTLSLPFKDNTFDAIIMIAVIHHIPPDEHYKVLNEIQRVLKPGGQALITNWAVEQPVDSRRTFTRGLNMVEWKGKESAPLPYWVMDRELAEEFIQKMPQNIICKNLKWSAGNWGHFLEKNFSTF
jgi:ubiquinone/menaquinone biosynthesis C-methylase UbiE